MKALVYEKAHTLDAWSTELRDVAEPTPGESDVLVEVLAVGINPGETFFRKTRSAEAGGRVLLGWEFAGEVVAVGRAVSRFEVGDRVFGTGDVRRDGAWAQRVAVDHRVVAKIPDALSFAAAASLPIGAITAWEAMFRDADTLPVDINRVLVIGGAGAVGTLAVQLLKAKTDALVIATASRPESRAWCENMGADLVVDHAADVVAQLKTAGVPSVDMVLSTANSPANLPWIAGLLRPFGHIAVVDGAPTLDASVLVPKAASLHTEMIFSRLLNDCAPEKHAAILDKVLALFVEGRLRPIATKQLEGLTAETMRAAHELVESRSTIGKIVISTS
ncbi:MAG: zinc-binding dehydrogenase [Pseudomonadota bacterium]